MTAALLPLFVAVPLLGAGIAAFARAGSRWPRPFLVVLLVADIAAAVVALTATADGTVLAHGVGGWPGGISIPFAADAFSVLMVLVAGVLTLACSIFAFATDAGRNRLFAALVLALLAGVNGALLTADLFNLFVFIEVMLLPSYGLLVLSRTGTGTLRSVLGSRVYVTFNLFVSTVFLAGVGLVYGVAGTVNLAELAGAAREDDLVAAALGLCLFALSMKAAVVPVHGWLARAYPSTSPAITALFSGLHTKVAIYAMYRIYAVAFEGDERFLWIGVVAFSATMLVGVLGAVGEDRMRSILAFHMVSQIGYILLGLALFTPAGLAAGIFYLLHHMIVKASLFLTTGAVEQRYGTDRLDELRGRVRPDPVLAVAFGVAALSLAGLPPLSGFVAKLTLITASIEADQIAAAVVALVVSLVTLLSMLKIFNAVFGGAFVARGSRRDPEPALRPSPAFERAVATAPRKTTALLAGPGIALAAVTLTLGLGAQLLYPLAQAAAAGLLDTSAYVTAVLS